MRGLSPVAASGGHSSSRCAGLPLSRPLLLWSTGSRRAGSVIAAHGPTCSAARGILPDQGSNPCPLHWQADSQPLRHQGSPSSFNFNFIKVTYVLHHEVKCYISHNASQHPVLVFTTTDCHSPKATTYTSFNCFLYYLASHFYNMSLILFIF